MDEAIQEIAVKHGVVLSKDDPILILQTMNERLIEENRKSQQEILDQFREEMESISSKWRVDAKEKAEKVLNAALSSSKEAMTKLLQEAINESVQSIRTIISDSLNQTNNLKHQTRKNSLFALLISTGTIIGSYLFFNIF